MKGDHMAKYKGKITKQEELILETSKDLLRITAIKLEHVTNHYVRQQKELVRLLEVAYIAKKESDKATKETDRLYTLKGCLADELYRLKTLKEYKDKRKNDPKVKELWYVIAKDGQWIVDSLRVNLDHADIYRESDNRIWIDWGIYDPNKLYHQGYKLKDCAEYEVAYREMCWPKPAANNQQL